MNYIKFFNQLTIENIPEVGGKNASLGEMYKKLAKKGIRVPNGFATTAEAYNNFLDYAGIRAEIKDTLKGLDTHNMTDLAKRGAHIRKIILDSPFSKDFEDSIRKAYRKLSNKYRHTLHPSRGGNLNRLDVAVRSSATAEDLPGASFAGQQETFLNIQGEKQLLLAVKKCIASLFTNRAISYRVDKGFDHFKVALSVGVQKMIRADIGSSGVMFTIDTESGFRDLVIINSIYGLGENIVQGKVEPDEFFYFKKTGAIISKHLGRKKLRMVYGDTFKNNIYNIKVKANEQRLPSISDKQVLELAHWGMEIEKHYKKPMDIEWALDGRDNKLYIIQARPETVQSERNYNIIETHKFQGSASNKKIRRKKVIATGQSVGAKIGLGKVNKIMDTKNIKRFKAGQVLVTEMTDPDWEPIMKKASAIVTDQGGRTCHAAIVSRELGVPCVVGTLNGSKKIKQNQAVTVSCAEGEQGFIYDGELEVKVNKVNIKNLKKPKKIKIMMNVGEPNLAFQNAMIPNDGVGLARLEFIINNHIKIHPLALLNYKKIKDQKLKKKIDDLTFGYDNKKQYFIDKLSEGVAMIAAAFYPKDVIVRLSDFKSNEYANLIGGQVYEPVEPNPMIGWRGASRYYSPKFLPAFEMECKALKRVREEMGLTNVKIMIPFCRTIEEGKKVLGIMKKNGLKQGMKGLEVYVMAEIPSNIILAQEFAQIFDGFSIGSNDLTQLTLGIDRDSAGKLEVAGISNEKNQAVTTLIKYLIQVGKETGTKVGICGQAPSDFPDFAKFLYKEGIDSISLIPDTVIKTIINLKQKKR